MDVYWLYIPRMKEEEENEGGGGGGGEQTATAEEEKEENDYTFILIAATGRSASTTLLRIVNTIPNSNISGENNNVIMDLLKCYTHLKCLSITPSPPSVASFDAFVQQYGYPAWYNSYDMVQVKKHFRQLIVSILRNKDPSTNVLGWKEIRYAGRLEELNTFVELFPRTKIICNYRIDTDRQVKSGFYTEAHRQEIVEYNDQLISYYERNRDFCYLFTFEDVFLVEKVEQLFAFLDQPFDEDKYTHILQNKLDYF